MKIHSQSLKIENLCFARPDTKILEKVDLDLKASEIASLIGPSGAGKTTLLRLIAGFERPQEGKISLGDRVLCEVGGAGGLSRPSTFVDPQKRGVGLVFQDFALFPHLCIRENIVFGMHRRPSAEIQKSLKFLSELLGLGDLLDRYPHQLSGGQQQRVAIARALAPGPSLLLLDEPFSQLDPELREELIEGLGSILRETRITTLLVTHHQEDAFDLSDKMGVLHESKMQQWDTPFDLYHKPDTRFVANFVGKGVFIAAETDSSGMVKTELGTFKVPAHQLKSLEGELHEWQLLLRPDDVIHDDNATTKARVVQKRFRGSLHLYTLELASGARVLSYVPSHHNHCVGEEIGIRVELDHVNIFL